MGGADEKKLDLRGISENVLNNKSAASTRIQQETQGGNDLNTALLNSKLANSREIFAAQGEIPTFKSLRTTSKLCSVYIPSIVYIPKAIVEVAQPTWSKQRTDQGYPIWSKVNVQFTGLVSAIAEENFLNLWDVRQPIKGLPVRTPINFRIWKWKIFFKRPLRVRQMKMMKRCLRHIC